MRSVTPCVFPIRKNIFGGNTLSVCRQDNLHIFMRNVRLTIARVLCVVVAIARCRRRRLGDVIRFVANPFPQRKNPRLIVGEIFCSSYRRDIFARTVDCEIVFDLFALGCLTIIYCAVLRKLCANLKIYRKFLPRYLKQSAFSEMNLM